MAVADRPTVVAAQPLIICADFTTWASLYSGPKFNLIHCDFPYGVAITGTTGIESFAEEDVYENNPEIYWHLVNTLIANLNRLASYQSHLIFWLSMKFYSETVAVLRKAGLDVQDHPFMWDKSPTGMSPRADKFPKRTYDTALICSRGDRRLVKHGLLSYRSPQPTPLMHPSQKSEPMYRQFLGMFVDETTTVLDPTCGYGGALRVADELGAKSILGLELDAEHARRALDATLRARQMRNTIR